jgi:hypothetical protein
MQVLNANTCAPIECSRSALKRLSGTTSERNAPFSSFSTKSSTDILLKVVLCKVWGWKFGVWGWGIGVETGETKVEGCGLRVEG